MTITIPFRDLAIRDAGLRQSLLDAVDRVLRHGRLILGPEVEQFESAIASYCGRRFAVGVGSGTDALYLSLRALGIGPGDEVITTPLSWIATVNAIVLTGARPVFVDIGDDLNLAAEQVEQAITPRTRAILPVHFTGRLCDIRTIVDIADRHGLPVIEDGGQAFGARLGEDVCGALGTLGCFSMNPMKLLNAFGEAGAVVTDDPGLRDRLLSLRYAGTVGKEDCHTPGLNGRIDTIQAAMLGVMLDHLPAKIERRRAIARVYNTRLDGVVTCPVERPGEVHTYYSHTIQCDHRDGLRDHLAARGIETKIQHAILMPHHPAYRERFAAAVPVAERLVRRILCLPNQEDLAMDAVETVCAAVRAFHGR